MARIGRGHPAGKYVYIPSSFDLTNPSSDEFAFATERDRGDPGILAIEPVIGDTGSGVEGFLVEVGKTDSDTGSFADVESDRSIASADVSGTTVEAVASTDATLPGSDTGSGAEAVSALDNVLSGADDGSGVDTDAQTEVVAADSGSSVDAVTNRQFKQGDTGGSVESGTPGSATPTSSDSGHFTETSNAISRGAPLYRTFRIPRENRTHRVIAD